MHSPTRMRSVWAERLSRTGITTRPQWFPPEFDWVVGCTYRGVPTYIAPVSQRPSAATWRSTVRCSSRQAAIRGYGNLHIPANLVGGRRRRLSRERPACEDTEFCIRAGMSIPTHIGFSTRRCEFGTTSRRRGQASVTSSPAVTDEGLAKARVVVEQVGARDGLSDERRYVAHTLPTGVLKGLATLSHPGTRGGPSAPRRSSPGVSMTGIGYAWGRLGLAVRGSTRRHRLTLGR